MVTVDFLAKRFPSLGSGVEWVLTVRTLDGIIDGGEEGFGRTRAKLHPRLEKHLTSGKEQTERSFE